MYALANSYLDPISAVTSKVFRNGQFSLPADIRRRWGAAKVVVIDQGDYVIVRPVPAEIVPALRGAYAGPGPTAEEVRRREGRAEEVRTSSRR